MLITRMRSLTSGSPGRRQQIPRTIKSMSTPARDARYNAAMTSASVIAFIFATMRAGRPARACSDSRAINSRNRSRSPYGATISDRNVFWRENPVRTLNRSVMSAPMRGSVVKNPRSVYTRAVREL